MILVGNKCDLGDDRRALTEVEGQKFADDNGLDFMETSAKTAINVEAVFLTLSKRLLKKSVQRDVQLSPKLSLVTPTATPRTNGKCYGC